MPAQLKILGVNHINQIVDDYDAAVGHLEDLFGGQFLREIGANPFTAGCLVDVGGEIIEVLAPKIMDKAEGKLLARYGPHYQGIEILVPSVPEALEVVKQRGVGILIERGNDFYTQPSATQGVCLQVFGGDWRADPPPAAGYAITGPSTAKATRSPGRGTMWPDRRAVTSGCTPSRARVTLASWP